MSIVFCPLVCPCEGIKTPETEVTDSCAPACGWMLGTEPRSFARTASTLNC